MNTSHHVIMFYAIWNTTYLAYWPKSNKFLYFSAGRACLSSHKNSQWPENLSWSSEPHQALARTLLALLPVVSVQLNTHNDWHLCYRYSLVSATVFLQEYVVLSDSWSFLYCVSGTEGFQTRSSCWQHSSLWVTLGLVMPELSRCTLYVLQIYTNVCVILLLIFCNLSDFANSYWQWWIRAKYLQRRLRPHRCGKTWVDTLWDRSSGAFGRIDHRRVYQLRWNRSPRSRAWDGWASGKDPE